MHSIRSRIMVIILLAILVCIAAIGGLGIFSIKYESDLSAEREMRLICDDIRQSIDANLNSIEQSVNIVSEYAADGFPERLLAPAGALGLTGLGNGRDRDWSSPAQAALDRELHDHSAGVEKLFSILARYTNGVMAFYYRLNPELSQAEPGFFYSTDGSGDFVRVPVTDIRAYDADDTTHVGWYYIPLREGRAVWTEPYYNDNLGVKMISYEIPLYFSGSFVGLVGMDVSFATLVEQFTDMRMFRNGYVCLLEPDGTVIYHPDLEAGLRLRDYESEMTELTLNFDSQGDDAPSVRYHDHGVEKQACFTTLSNGMKLVVVVPVADINYDWLRLAENIFLAAVVILVVFCVISALLTKRLTKPLQRLTAAAKRVANGDYDVRLEYQGRDEVGVLTGVFQHVVEHLRCYISDLNSRVYQDAMTGVKNKGAYEIAEHQLNESISAAKAGGQAPPEFAVIMLDCNDLKTINDVHGHEKGDIYLQTACGLICHVFPHSPVFRMGGDEFAVLLQGSEYRERDAMMLQFDAAMEKANAAASNPWDFVHIAKGMAAYDPAQDDNAESVLHRADERMYEDKRAIKAKNNA